MKAPLNRLQTGCSRPKHRSRDAFLCVVTWHLVVCYFCNLLPLFYQTSSESLLDPQQIQAFDQLCRLNRGTSRVCTHPSSIEFQLGKGILLVVKPSTSTGSVGFGFSLGFRLVL